MATTPNQRQILLSELVAVAISDLVGLWRRATLADVDFAQFLIEAFPEIAATYAVVAADLAADWYEQSAPQLSYRPVPAEIDTDALTGSARWALGAQGDTALDRLSGTMQRAVFNGSRETTLLNVEAEAGATWARHASANACEFCRMLATRLDAYTSRSSASFKSHDHCHCVAIEVRPGEDYEPAPYVEDWQEQYNDARRNAPKSDTGAVDPRDLLAQWRLLNK